MLGPSPQQPSTTPSTVRPVGLIFVCCLPNGAFEEGNGLRIFPHANEFVASVNGFDGLRHADFFTDGQAVIGQPQRAALESC